MVGLLFGCFALIMGLAVMAYIAFSDKDKKNRRKIVYIDMDDTICHFARHYLRSRHDYPEFNPWPQSRPGFFRELEPIEGAKETIAKLQEHFDVWILTKPSYMNAHCYTDKRLWLEEHYGIEFCQKLILCPDKGLMRGDYLIDDVLWKDFKGVQIQFGKGDIQNWDDVYNYIMKLEGKFHYIENN